MSGRLGPGVMLPLVCALLLTACGGGEKKTGGGGAADKNHLVIAAMSSPTNLDSRVGNDNVSGRMFDLIYSGLVRITPNMDYAPDVAEKWETPDDKTIVFHLNPKAKFHNGQPVKAADVKWTYDSLMAADFISSNWRLPIKWRVSSVSAQWSVTKSERLSRSSSSTKVTPSSFAAASSR